jgi:hypothetical protein
VILGLQVPLVRKVTSVLLVPPVRQVKLALSAPQGPRDRQDPKVILVRLDRRDRRAISDLRAQQEPPATQV